MILLGDFQSAVIVQSAPKSIQIFQPRSQEIQGEMRLPRMLIPSRSEADVPKFSPRIVILVPGVASLGLMPVTTGCVGAILEGTCHGNWK